jgi:hypothetical protein
MPDLTYLLIVLWDIAISGFQIGWPLFIVAFGLARVAYFGEKDKIKTIWGWGIALGGLFLFLFNLKIVIG